MIRMMQGSPATQKTILLIMPLAIMRILSFSMNKICQEILRAIALAEERSKSKKE
jgi:hypothetical protein